MKRFEAKCDDLGRGGDHRRSYRLSFLPEDVVARRCKTNSYDDEEDYYGEDILPASSSWLVGLKDPMSHFVDLEYVGSWNDLVCLRVWNFSPASMVLWNPARSWRHESREDFEEEEEEEEWTRAMRSMGS
ncbi:hypothetical protein LINGRAHAP2_LOCUS26387 [Linum grandiflorum]